MRIALVATHHAEYAANLAIALAGRHEVLLILSRRTAARQLRPEALAELRERLRLRIVPHHYAPLQPLVAALCRRHILSFRPDVVHAQEHPTRSTFWLARALGRRLPFVLTVHDPLPHSGNDARAAANFARYNGRLRGMADALIVHGEGMADQLAQVAALPRERVRAIPHGVLHFGALHAAAAPAPDPRRLIFFGRMERYKGLDTLLDANAIWLRSGTEVELVVAGTGPEIVRLRERMAAMPNLRLHGHRVPQEELERLVASAAAAVLPYHDATQSGAAASAIGAGVPVIATRVGGLPEVIRDGVNGLLVPPGDAEALAETGRRFMYDTALQQRLRAGARATAEGALSWARIAEMTVEIYERVMRR